MFGSFLQPDWGSIVLSIIAYLIILYAVLETGRAWVFFVAVAAVVIAFWSTVAFFVINAVSYFVQHPINGTLALVGFVVLGVAVALLKWRAYVIERIEYAKGLNRKEESVDERIKFAMTFVPLAKQNKSRIASWIGWWPFYTLDYLILLVFRDFFNKVAEYTQGLFNKVTDTVSNNAIEAYRKEITKEVQ